MVSFLRGTVNEDQTFSVNPTETRGRSLESMELTLKALTEPQPFGWEGRFYQFRTVAVWPRPLQQPLPPTYVLTRSPEDNAVREALVYALRYDKNPGVRLKSLDGLKSYVKDDVQVRDAVIEALLHDNNAGVRQEAISLLDSVKADSSVRAALTVLAERDANKFIREESKRYLASTPHLD